jgi:predicted DCC family thiol-disulfide oxidoreductase YuxK
MTLLYSGGCKVCRWMVRTIVQRFDPSQLDIVPFRHPIGQNILRAQGIPEDQWFRNWWFQDESGYLWAGNQGGVIQFLLSFPRTYRLGVVMDWWNLDGRMNRLDNWVKAHRPFIAQFIKDGPALIRVKGQERWE